MTRLSAASMLALLLLAASGQAIAQETGDSTKHEYYGDPSEGHFGDPGAGHFGSPPQQRWSDYEPVTVRPLRAFDDRYEAALAAKQQKQQADDN